MSDRTVSRDGLLSMLLLAAVVGAAACDEARSPTAPSGADAVGMIENNHGHTAIVTARQLADGRALGIDIHGTANHGHLVELTDDNMRRLQRRERVELDSSLENGHKHRVTFN